MGADRALLTTGITIGSCKLEAMNSISCISARPWDDVELTTRPPAAAAPTQALKELCSLSTRITSVLSCPLATKPVNLCIMSVAGVIGYAAHTSGAPCLKALATASFPETATNFAITCPPPASQSPSCLSFQGTQGHRCHNPYNNRNRTLPASRPLP